MPLRLVVSLALFGIACGMARPPRKVEVGRTTGGIAASLYAFRVSADGRAELDLYGRTLKGTVSPDRATTLIALATSEQIWRDLHRAKITGESSQDAEPGAIWVRLGRREISFNPFIFSVVERDGKPDVVESPNTPMSVLPLLNEMQAVCREVIEECRFYKFAPVGAQSEMSPARDGV
jgi:hypothetical protein